MSEYKISKEIGINSFEIILSIDLDDNGFVENYEFFDGFKSYDNPSDIRFSCIYCTESVQEEWDLFLYDLLDLFESGQLFKKIEKLKEDKNSYYFSQEQIDVVLIENI